MLQLKPPHEKDKARDILALNIQGFRDYFTSLAKTFEIQIPDEIENMLSPYAQELSTKHTFMDVMNIKNILFRNICFAKSFILNMKVKKLFKQLLISSIQKLDYALRYDTFTEEMVAEYQEIFDKFMEYLNMRNYSFSKKVQRSYKRI